jgi:hypothetical protein
MLFSIYTYNIVFWSQEYVEKVGNLVSYKGVFFCMAVVELGLSVVRCLLLNLFNAQSKCPAF